MGFLSLVFSQYCDVSIGCYRSLYCFGVIELCSVFIISYEFVFSVVYLELLSLLPPLVYF